jgi:hypothetical protein
VKNRTRQQVEYHERLAEGLCVLCELLGRDQASRTTIHHIREGQGMSQRASHWLVIPVCEECHQGQNGIHGDRQLLRLAKVEEVDLLAETIERVVA